MANDNDGFTIRCTPTVDASDIGSGKPARSLEEAAEQVKKEFLSGGETGWEGKPSSKPEGYDEAIRKVQRLVVRNGGTVHNEYLWLAVRLLQAAKFTPLGAKIEGPLFAIEERVLNGLVNDLSMLADGEDTGTREPLSLGSMRDVARATRDALLQAWQADDPKGDQHGTHKGTLEPLSVAMLTTQDRMMLHDVADYGEKGKVPEPYMVTHLRELAERGIGEEGVDLWRRASGNTRR